MNQPPNPMNTPSGYGPPPGYGQPSAPVPQSGYGAPSASPYPPQYPPPPHGVRGFTRQMFNPAAYRQQGSGAYAAASLILAIIGWVTLGCLGIITWPLGMLFGLIGLVGNKRSKGLSFAGFVLSGAGIGLGVALMAFGFHLQFMKATMAEQAGAPVVAAIDRFKEENKRVPHDLDELVAGGFLPATWNNGLDDVDSHVRDAVKDRKWGEFLRYKAGEDATWEGSGWSSSASIHVDMDGFDFHVDADGDGKAHQTYGLVFYGIDKSWGTDDDAAVNQSPDKAYDLNLLWGGDESSREAMKATRELKLMIARIDGKVTELDQSLNRATTNMQDREEKLRKVMDDKRLRTLEAVKKDAIARERLKLVGETAALIGAIEAKQSQLKDDRARLEIQMERLDNQVELSKLSGSKDELAKLQQLLSDSKKTLEADDSYFAKVTEDEAADKWFKENIR